MLKKTCTVGGLVIATATGALIMSSPASAVAPAWGGGGWGYGSHRVGGFNGNQNALFNRIRLRIRNQNNNVAINNQRQHERQREFQRQRQDPTLLPVDGAPAAATTPSAVR